MGSEMCIRDSYKTMDEVKAELLVNKVANRIALIRVTTLRQKLTEV